MKIEKRMEHLQTLMERSLEKGTSYGEVYMYESAIAELERVSNWLESQCKKNNRILSEQTGTGLKQYIVFQNTTGMDFRFMAIGVKLIRDSKEIGSYEIATVNWKNGEFAKLYFDVEIMDDDVLSFDPNMGEYQIMRGDKGNGN